MDVYQITRDFPGCERFGLQSQVRRAAVSVATNIVEGAGRRHRKEYAHFLNVANGSAFEIRYLLSLVQRLGYASPDICTELADRYTRLSKGLNRLISAIAHGD